MIQRVLTTIVVPLLAIGLGWAARAEGPGDSAAREAEDVAGPLVPRIPRIR